jgi:hypothetical protein
MATTDAATADLDAMPRPPRSPRRPRPAARCPPGRRGYASVGQILAAADDHGVQLTGPRRPDTSWQAGDDDAFDLTLLAIDYDAHHVGLPQRQD